MQNIFISENDHFKWSKQREYILSLETIDDTIREKAIDSLNFLEQELGRNFLKTYSVNHPLRQKISEKTKWQIEELIGFTDTLKTLKTSDSNYNKLLLKLLSHSDASSEAVTFVEIARMYNQEDFKISFIEEDKGKNKNDKTPDIEVINKINSDVFYIELTTLGKADSQKIISNNYNFFHNQFNYVPPQFPFYGKQKKIIIEEEYIDIKVIIDEAKRKVKENNQIIYYSDSRFNFLLAPERDTESFNEICKLNKIRPIHFDSLPHDFDETSRINSRLNKAKQIPQEYNGLLYISVTPLYFMLFDMQTAIDRLAANITKYQNLIGIVLYTKIVNAGETVTIPIGKHFFSQKKLKT
ncbi:hypothetical protein [Flavobacterium phycosphaerae]|uniref:hypothetical protein n=1 Tax=Flavobacterium phycosphaerae TaxID=2697515 RepID=UPI00138ADBD3|nr:hypothetical protein [Flavobacterium phycosphaerae]